MGIRVRCHIQVSVQHWLNWYLFYLNRKSNPLNLYQIKVQTKVKCEDPLIDALRALRHKNAYMKQKELKKKRIKNGLKELNEKKSRNYKTNCNSYDQHGHLISLKVINKLPSLKTINSNITKSETRLSNYFTPKDEGHNVKEVLDVNNRERNEIEEAVKLATLYESLVPAAGVIFKENGKDPKTNLTVCSKSTEKLTRFEYNSLFLKSQIKTSTHSPITKNRIQRINDDYQSFECKANTQHKSKYIVAEILNNEENSDYFSNGKRSQLPKRYVPPLFREEKVNSKVFNFIAKHYKSVNTRYAQNIVTPITISKNTLLNQRSLKRLPKIRGLNINNLHRVNLASPIS